MKRCTCCKEVKELTEFHKHKNKPDGLSYICKTCTAIKRKAYYSTHKEKKAEYQKAHKEEIVAYKKEHYKARGRNSQYLRKYNITLQEYDDILASQGGHCACCDAVCNPYGTRLCVDHDHTTNEVRGILCTSCNTVLGYVNDDVETLLRLTAYLVKHGHKE